MKIMFVCHGNICRSPMAEIIFRDLLDKAGLQGKLQAFSAATSTEELGNGIYPPARAELYKHGLSGSHIAVQLEPSDYDKYDLFILMDGRNLRYIRRIFPSDPAGKIRMLLPHDVSDPWYTDDFSAAYADIFEGCTKLLEELKAGV